MAPKTHTYKDLDVVAIPEDIPKLGIEAGDPGTVTLVYGDPEGRTLLHVAADRDDGTTAGFVDLEVVSEDGNPSLRVVGYSTLGS
jgi:hypothetical protein